jgi:hypothetical protein
VDIFTALDAGSIHAEFHGNGPDSVKAYLTREPGGPTEVVIPAGSVFRIAALPSGGGGGGAGGFGGGTSFGQRGGGGRGGQGMFGFGDTRLAMAFTNSATAVIPTVCMDYGKREPTPKDPMLISPLEDSTLVRLASLLSQGTWEQPAAQLAMWAMRSDLGPGLGDRYLRRVLPGARNEDARREAAASARELLALMGLDPAAFTMFRLESAEPVY